MKIAILSDIHNRIDVGDVDSFKFSDLSENIKKSLKDVDVFVFTGDISTCPEGYDFWIKYFKKEISNLGNNKFDLLSVRGNHDYYCEKSQYMALYYELAGKDINSFKPDKINPNKILFRKDNISFIGTTLWSPPQEERCFKLTDFYLIDWFNERWNGDRNNIFKLYKSEKNWLIRTVKKEKKEFPNNKIVVFTHHAPISELIPEQYRNCDTSFLNSCFVNVVPEDNKKFKNLPVDLWIYGHTHENKDITINNIRFVSNQRGYKSEEELYYDFKPIIVEL